jgi:hypothetical protein
MIDTKIIVNFKIIIMIVFNKSHPFINNEQNALKKNYKD